MGDIHQLAFVDQHADQFEGPFLEVGSHDYGSTQDLRSRFSAFGEYVGLDLNPGPGVDVHCDLTLPFDEIDRRLGGRRFGTIFCLSVLEHCTRPFHMAENIERLLAPGGRVCVSVPFAWQFHGYPSDYWRFTHEGVRQLFPGIVFDAERCVAASPNGEFAPTDTEIGKREFRTKPHLRRGRWWRAIGAAGLRLLGRGPTRWATGYPYVLAPTMISMIGRATASEESRESRVA
jgi:SAM-dependent methyltransferase